MTVDLQALNVIPRAILALLRKSVRRVVLIAGNSELAFRDFDRLSLSASDLIVLINRCMHVARFARMPNPKLFIFREVADTGTHHGFPPNPSNFAMLDSDGLDGTAAMIFTRTKPPLETWPPAAQKIAQNADDNVTIVSDECVLWADYPRKPKYKFGGPSTGFMAVTLLLALKEDKGFGFALPEFEILTVGFGANSSDHLWAGHSWEYEREFLNQHRDSVCPFPLGEPVRKAPAVAFPADYRGELIRRFGALDRGLEIALRAVETSINSACNLAALAAEAHAQGQPQLALELLNDAVTLDSKNTEAHRQRGIVLHQLNEFTESVKGDCTLAKALQDDGKGLEALQILSDALTRSNDRPADVYALLLLRSSLLEALGFLDRALTDARHASELVTVNIHPKEDIAALLEKMGSLQTALGMLNEAIALDERQPALHHQKSALLERLGRIDEALASARGAVGLAGNNPHFYAHLATLLARKNDFQEALLHVDHAIRIDPHIFSFHTRRASLLESLGLIDEALLSAKRAVNLDSTKPWPHAILAQLLARTEDLSSALREIEAAIAASPRAAHFHHQRSVILQQAGQMAEAVQSARQALTLQPDNQSYQMRLRQLGKLGDPKTHP